MESPYYEMTHDIEEEHRSFQSGYINGYNDAMMKFPSMLVRRKDCKYKGNSVFREDGTEYIVCWNQGYGMQHPADWFCADGKRKEGSEVG